MNTVQSNERPMSVEQRKLIFALYRECGIGADLRHDVQHGVAGKTSLTDFTSHDAARLIEHLERLSQSRAGINLPGAGYHPSKRDAGGAGVTPRPPAIPPASPATLVPANQTKMRLDSRLRGNDSRVHHLPSPEQLAVLDHLFTFAGYTSEDTRRAFADRIEKHPRPRSMWEAEELIFALVAQAAPKMLAAVDGIEANHGPRLTGYEYGFLFTNRSESYMDGAHVRRTWNAAKIELEAYMAKRNKRGRRTMPRFSLTKFFEIVEKYR